MPVAEMATGSLSGMHFENRPSDVCFHLSVVTLIQSLADRAAQALIAGTTATWIKAEFLIR